jgi:hypothetical protein
MLCKEDITFSFFWLDELKLKVHGGAFFDTNKTRGNHIITYIEHKCYRV